MAKLNEFLKSLIIKAGSSVDEEAIKAALSTIAVDTEVKDELVSVIERGLLSIDSAKNNHPDIKRHYYASAYNGLDSELDRLIEDEKLPDEVVTELKAEKSS